MRRFFILLVLGAALYDGRAQSYDSLRARFAQPPAAARPRVWWHWMNGNVTKEGITADLEWMKRVGIGGMQVFDIGGTEQVVKDRLVWMTPAWKDALRHAAAEADRLGLEMSMAASGGWSETAGPWVKPEEAMKRVVFSDTIMDGGRASGRRAAADKAGVVLPTPGDLYHFPKTGRAFYLDTKVLAWRLPDSVRTMREANPVLTRGGVDNAWVQIDFARPFTSYGLKLDRELSEVSLQYSLDGAHWINLVSGLSETNAFPRVAARHYRLYSREKELQADVIELLPTPRIAGWWDKAQYGGERSHYDGAKPEFPETPRIGDGQAIAAGSILDITDRLHNGVLDWQPPAGRWQVLRLGATLTGQINHPASPEAEGFEVDKLSYRHVHSYFSQYLDMLAGAAGPYLGKSFRYLLMDSWECNTENWSDEILSEFRKRRGYEAFPYLPALAGYVVAGTDESDRFLLDYRRTLAEVLADNHYKLASDMLAAKGMGLYAEATGIHIQTTADGLLTKGQVAVPMGEFWMGAPKTPGLDPQSNADIHEVASAAHIYGKGIAAAESFTGGSGWMQRPVEIKLYTDWALSMGVNRFVIHTSVHQPFTDEAHKPGFTLMGFGQHYTRNNTWAEQMATLNQYMARCSHLLQQGLFVADIAYYYGDGAPVVVPFWKTPYPAPPKGYSYDWMNTDVLVNRLSVKDRRLVLPDGMSYRVLVLPQDVQQLTLKVAQQLRRLVAAGATIIAPRPTHTPGLAGYPAADDSLRVIADELWGKIDGTLTKENRFGEGRVIWGKSVEEVLAGDGVAADFESTKPDLDGSIGWIHRRTADADIYFVCNPSDRPVDITTRYRITGKAPECWNAEDGTVAPAAYTMVDTLTTVPLHLDSYGSTFVVFARPATDRQRVLPVQEQRAVLDVTGSWTLRFPAGKGAPAQVRMDTLRSWSVNADTGIKYFSGTATYLKNISVPKSWLAGGARIMLDLGEVYEVAEVVVNGSRIATLIKPGYRVDITPALRAGNNQVEIAVTNLWQNRLIGDAQPGNHARYTFTTTPPGPDWPLLPSGLLGPVKLIQVTER